MTDTSKPKTWGEMTDAEKGALLLAHHENRTIQMWHNSGGWFDSIEFGAVDDIAYRVKPEPKREALTLNAYFEKGSCFVSFLMSDTPTHQIIIDLIDDEPDCDSIRMERVDD